MFNFFVLNTYDDPQIYYNFTFHLSMNLSPPQLSSSPWHLMITPDVQHQLVTIIIIREKI